MPATEYLGIFFLALVILLAGDFVTSPYYNLNRWRQPRHIAVSVVLAACITLIVYYLKP
jgi:hypothetical protein